ncbi:hypothetical protein MLD38_006828 [Melastoma candidum]|uniref:Uncharacterized protein n=1 Tax=Melastoma candidum TaxID=119954 RepID=A0ACB9RS53_9MYRT|nr:hypothetical protein MLD38_006828 [Melastoma candidum]
MGSGPKELLAAVESALLSPTPPTPSQRLHLSRSLRKFRPSLHSLLSYPPPKASDRAQVQQKEVRLPDSPPIRLDDQDVQIALKLSDELHLNEIECVRLLLHANQDWGLMGREPLEIYRLAAGLWYTERRDLITALYTLLRAVVLDQVAEADIIPDIQKYLEDLINDGLRQRLISLIKELNREEPAGFGGPLCEHHVLDSRGTLAERAAVVCRERLILGHCLVLSVLVVRITQKDAKDIFYILKDAAAELGESDSTAKQQIAYSMLFSLIIAFVSDALSTVPDRGAVLTHDSSFRNEFHEMVVATGNNKAVEAFIDGVRLAWAVHLMLIQDPITPNDRLANLSSSDLQKLHSCVDIVFKNNVFQSLLDNVLKTAAYLNEDEDMIYMYHAYLHKLVTFLLTHPLARDKVKEAKEKAMSMFIPHRMVEYLPDGNSDSQKAISNPSFVSLLEFVSEIYEREPELLSGNDVLWTFVTFAGEDHTSIQTLVAFLRMLSTLASSEEGASKVYELLQGKAFRAVGWSTLFDCLSIYGEKLKQSLQTTGAMLPEFLDGDAKALVAYLNVLQKVMENGNPVERKNWFSNIEPLFKLLGYENVPSYLKGALRNAIATFVHVSPVLKDTIWSYLEQYDLPVVVSSNIANLAQSVSPVYDMQFELNEIEARNERYPSTISFVNLINTLIAEERDVTDRGHKFIGIFKFVSDHVFGPFPQRAYADPHEKWQLVTACLQHFHMMLSMYDVLDEDIDSVVEKSQTSVVAQPSSLQAQLPVLELLKDFMSGKTVFRNIMAILLPGVDSIISERSSQTYGHLLEKALQLCLEIIVLVLEKDPSVSEFWRPLYQPLDVILSQDPNQVTCLLEYVRYDLQQQIQLSSIKIMSILSSRMVGLSQLLLTSDTASGLTEDYAACLESRLEESQVIESSNKDPGVLIMQVLIDNIGRPAPNIAHILLKFDVDGPIERTVLQPKFHYSCLKIILEALETLGKPDLNALIHEFGFQLLYELCLDPLTSVPTMDLLANRRYQFFVQHLDTIGTAPLPKRMYNQQMRINSLHQRAWLLKLLALELHAADIGISSHRETCQKILVHLFGLEIVDAGGDRALHGSFALPGGTALVGEAISKNKALDLLEVVQFRYPDTSTKLSEVIPAGKFQLLAEEILSNPATSESGGIYYYSERGDRLIDLASFSDKLWQKMNVTQSQVMNVGSEFELNDVRESVQLLLRWAWKYDKNLEEKAAQLHMLTAWSQLVEVSVSRRLSLLEERSDILHQILDATLGASASPDCSVKMAYTLSQVALTCMGKLRDEKFAIPGALTSDGVTCLDIIVAKQLSNGACHSILIKLIMAILRRESSEALRRRQYALLLSYFQYCQHMLDPDIPTKVLESLLLVEEDSVDFDLQKINKEQMELARANFSLVRKEAQGVLDLVTKDATQGSEAGKTIAFYVIDALICIDQDRYFLNQLQSRGFLRSCLVNISNFTFQDGGHSLLSMQRACTFEAELALLLRISHKYGKSGAQVLFSMGALEHVSSCKVISLQGPRKQVEFKLRDYRTNDVDKDRMVVTPVLRLLFSLTSLVETSDIFEVKNKIAREIIDFVRRHEVLFDQVLRQDIYANTALVMEQINLVVGVLSKIWPYEEIDNHGFIQTLFSMMCDFFSRDFEGQRNSDFNSIRLCFGLVSYLYSLVTKKSVRLQVSQNLDNGSSARMFHPTLMLLCSLLNSVSLSMERAAEEKSLLLLKIQNINELSRQEVDEVISGSNRIDFVSATDNLQKRRYIAVLEMCQAAAKKERLLTLLLPLAEQILNIILIHSQESSILPDAKTSSRAITYGTERGVGQDVNHFCSELIQVLERLELLSEDKAGHNLKVFHSRCW